VRLEDVFLCLRVGADHPEAAAVCRAAAAVGADMIRAVPAAGAEAVLGVLAGVCREAGSLLVIEDQARLAAQVGAGGVHLTDAESPLGLARAEVGLRGIVGVSVRNLQETQLAIELHADYLVHRGGMDCLRDFALLGQGPGIPVFADGLAGLDEARRLSERGLHRFCIETGAQSAAAVGELVADYSRLIGRCV